MTDTSPGVDNLGLYKLSFNRNKTVVIWCPYHDRWITAAAATNHFRYGHPKAITPKGGTV